MSLACKQWFSVLELIGLPDIPGTHQNIKAKAKRESWIAQPKKEGRGGGFEYHINSLPPQTQVAIYKKLGKVQVGEQVFELPTAKRAPKYCRKSLWERWNNAGTKGQEKAKKKLIMVQSITSLMAGGLGKLIAIGMVSKEHGVSVPTLRRDCKAVEGIDKEDWAPALLPKNKESAAVRRDSLFAPISDEAWAFFKSDYLRLEAPNLATCYYRLLDAAKTNHWVVPSVDSVTRRLAREIPAEIQVLLREGEHALMTMYPAQQRTVANINAMEWINGDGYQHNVFVKWHNGEILRPKTWFWQDVRTRKIVGYRCDLSENSDSIRLSLKDVIAQYGIPNDITIDNTRAAANKWLTGGVANRYRFKVKDDDPIGLIPMLGINLHWSCILFGQGHGQAKPIERAFGVGGLGEFIDKHPALAGAYTGPNPMAKPDNYGANAIPVDVFLNTIASGVQTFNDRRHRETEICGGEMSFNQAFDASFKDVVIRKPTSEQLRLFMLMAEATKVKRDGTITLKSGGKIQGQENRYQCQELYRYIGKKIVARVNPDALHNPIYCYTLEGVLIGEAQCISPVAFGCKAGGREQRRQRKKWHKATKKASQAYQAMTELEMAAKMRPIEEELTPPPAATEMVHHTEGNVMRKRAVSIETDEYEANMTSTVAELMAQKRKNQL